MQAEIGRQHEADLGVSRAARLSEGAAEQEQPDAEEKRKSREGGEERDVDRRGDVDRREWNGDATRSSRTTTRRSGLSRL